MKTVNWKSVLIFYLLACTLSWPFFWWKDLYSADWSISPVPFWLRGMGLMWGPGIAAILCFWIFRRTHQRTITFWGTSKLRCVSFLTVPVLLLALVHPPSDRLPFSAVGNLATTHLTPLLFIWGMLLAFGWALGEELGWRGFLQDALRPMPFALRFLLLGVLWAFWHFTNYTANRSLKVVAITLAISYPAFLLLTFLIGIAVERSRSLWVAVAIHAWVDLSIQLRTERTFIVLAVSILYWIVILWSWPQPVEKETQRAVVGLGLFPTH